MSVAAIRSLEADYDLRRRLSKVARAKAEPSFAIRTDVDRRMGNSITRVDPRKKGEVGLCSRAQLSSQAIP
jgi:hypothetical protein